MSTRSAFVIAVLMALCGCNRLAHQASVHVRLQDETKTISDLARELSSRLTLVSNGNEFDYGGPKGRQVVYELFDLTKVISVSTASASYCDDEPDPDHIRFNDRLLAVNVGASTEAGLEKTLVKLREASEAIGGSVVADSKLLCPAGNSDA